MMTSGSTSSKKSRHFISISPSLLNDKICVATIGLTVSIQKTFRMNGLGSPYLVTTLAIWMTGSTFASGKIPLRPAHSISKERMRRGAILDHSPSDKCAIRSL